MRARAVISSTLASIGLLAIGWQTGAPLATAPGITTSAPVAPGPVPSSGASTSPPAPASAAPTAPVAPAAPAPGPVDGSYVGDAVRTQFGDVQVQITIAGGTIADVVPMHLTDRDGRSVAISNRAAPILRSEVLASQSAQVSVVSGATYTSIGYLRSLQSALDAAGA